MKYLVVIFLTFCLSSVAALADLIALNTENTGQNTTTSNGVTTDNNWTYSNFYNVDGFGSVTDGTPGTHAIVVTSQPSVWIPDTVSPAGFWLGPAANQNDNSSVGTVGGNAPGVYVYQLTFNSTTARTVQVSGRIAADNDYEIAYGATVSSATIAVQAPGGSSTMNTTNYGFNLSTTTQQYASLSSFSFDLSVGAGSTTTLDFLVMNQNNGYNNPTGIFVTDLEVVAVPEPPTWAIVLAGLGLMAFGRRILQRRQNAGC